MFQTALIVAVLISQSGYEPFSAGQSPFARNSTDSLNTSTSANSLVKLSKKFGFKGDVYSTFNGMEHRKKGYLLAVDDSMLYLLNDHDILKIDVDSIQAIKVVTLTSLSTLTAISAFMIPLCLSHGLIAIVTIPLNLLNTGLVAIITNSTKKKYTLTLSPRDMETLKRYLLFPEGLPEQYRMAARPAR